MYNDLDIADWILPLMYAGHLRHLYWVKPPWANQIAEKTLHFAVGKEVNTGLMKLTSTEDYFLEDCMYVSKEKLTNIRDVVVESIELETLHKEVHLEKSREDASSSLEKTDVIGKCDKGDAIQCSATKKTKMDSEQKKIAPELPAGINSINNSIQHQKKPTLDILRDVKYILDIDLDFYSVTNPFKGDYTPQQFETLKRTYFVQPPTCKTDTAFLQRWISETEQKISNLRAIIDLVATGSSTDDIETDTNIEFIALLKSLKGSDGEEVDWDLVHNAGLSMGVPHHVSTEAEVDVLVQKTADLLRMLPPPAVITVARSTVDEYCPPSQIEMIQEKVVKALREVYGDEKLHVHFDYSDDSRVVDP